MPPELKGFVRRAESQAKVPADTLAAITKDCTTVDEVIARLSPEHAAWILWDMRVVSARHVTLLLEKTLVGGAVTEGNPANILCGSNQGLLTEGQAQRLVDLVADCPYDSRYTVGTWSVGTNAGQEKCSVLTGQQRAQLEKAAEGVDAWGYARA